MTGVTWRPAASFAFLILALGLGGPTGAAAEALATISAAPSPFGSGATITIDASITGQWQGEPPTSCQPPDCQMGEVLDVDTHIVVEGSPASTPATTRGAHTRRRCNGMTRSPVK